ncbi:hypothetical protein TNCV_1232221 [Trichonephila clavipes]|nr:hypothetical protein TNCV_1232221 [Trichonephila clavipes]
MRRGSQTILKPLAPVQIRASRTWADSRCPTCAYSTNTCAYFRCPRACADSRCPTCADSSHLKANTCADFRCPRATVQIPDVLEPVQIPQLELPVQIPEPEPVQISDVLCRFQMS